jgi:hypothetical protein
LLQGAGFIEIAGHESLFALREQGNRGVYQGEPYGGVRNITGWAPVVATSELTAVAYHND